jgi:hypothetical protein
VILLAAYFRRIIDMQIRSVGIDLGKTIFHLVALGDNGKVLLKKKFTQKQLLTFTANLQTSLIDRTSTPPEARRSCMGSASAGTATSVRSLSMGLVLSCCDASETESRWVHG